MLQVQESNPRINSMLFVVHEQKEMTTSPWEELPDYRLAVRQQFDQQIRCEALFTSLAFYTSTRPLFEARQ